MNYKKSVQDSMKRYYERQLNQGVSREVKAKNKKPEKNTEAAVLEWSRHNNCFLHVIESSSFDPVSRRKTLSKAQAGFPDIVGNTNDGLSLYIELKAKDRRSTLREDQRSFLIMKIHQGCFAAVVDSRERLEQYWKGYHSLKTINEKKSYLLDCLPNKRKKNSDEPLF